MLLAAAALAVASACTPGGSRGSDNRTDQLCEKMLRRGGRGETAEAREWLRDAARAVGERSHAQSLALVEELYALGAKEVVAVDLGERAENAKTTTSTLIVVLPEDPAARRGLFAHEEALMKREGVGTEGDVGQKYLLLFKLR